jgi:hypothetical protein
VGGDGFVYVCALVLPAALGGFKLGFKLGDAPTRGISFHPDFRRVSW